jgi:hypothetical protein
MGALERGGNGGEPGYHGSENRILRYFNHYSGATGSAGGYYKPQAGFARPTTKGEWEE